MESGIAAWKAEIVAKSHLAAEEVQDLEDHLRDEMEALQKAGLAADEALLIGIRRMGNSAVLAGELALANSDKLWRHLMQSEAPPEPGRRQEVVWVILAALVAAGIGKLPLLFGVDIYSADSEIYARNSALFVVPVLIAGYYLVRRFSASLLAFLGALIVVATVAVNTYPFQPGGSSSLLTILHLPILLWLLFGLAYTAGEWRNTRSIWDFIRFTGEFFIYCVLIGLGGMVFMMLTMMFFQAIRLPAERFLTEWVGYSGLLGIPVVAAYLVEKKRSLIENIAPVLARIFIPLFLVMTLAFIVAALSRLSMFWQDRNILITVDLLLVLVTGMVLYDLSARESEGTFTGSDLMSLLLMSAALIIDVLALGGIIGRLGQFGFSPNKIAALGENILLLGNLAGLIYAYVRLRQGKGSRRQLLSWQVYCLPAYLVWMAWVVFALPPIYRFV